MSGVQCLLLCLLLMATASGASLKKIVVLHRHGARGPIGVVGDGLLCSFPYCQLTDQGKNMCRSLGSYLKQTYNETYALYLPPRYNVSFISSTSTEYSRVVISAEAMIMGLYNGTEPLPFVDFVPKTQDLPLCMWNSWPTFKMHDSYQAAMTANNAVALNTLGAANLTAIGQYFGLADLCSNSPMDCVSFAQDYISCSVSDNTTLPAWLMDLWPACRSVVSSFLNDMLGYDPTNDYKAQIGSLGFPFASQAMQYFANPNTGLMTWRHYAAHDWTLLAVYSALGMWSPSDAGNTTFVPRFAETLILELWNGDDGQSYVRGLWGYPEQTVGAHPFSFKTANMTCMNNQGVSYKSADQPNQWCLLNDLWAFINSTAPQSDDGVCYVTDDMLSAHDCDGDDAPPVDSKCYFYRKHCPKAACGQTNGAIADAARGYLCQSNQLGKDTPFMAATVVALVAPSLLAGAIIGFYFSTRVKDLFIRCRGGSAGSEERIPIAQAEVQR